MNDKCRIVGINHVIDVDMPSMVKIIIQLCRKDLNFSVKGHKSKIYNKLCFPGRIMINISVVLNWFYIFLMKQKSPLNQTFQIIYYDYKMLMPNNILNY